MPYPRSFTSVTMNGTIANGEDIFSAGFHIGSSTTSLSPAVWRTAFLDIGEAIRGRTLSLFADQRMSIPTTVKLTDVTIAHLGTDGKYLQESLEFPVTQVGTNPNSSAPQNALVTTLVADKYKDPGKYNRFYLPVSLPGGSFQYKFPAADAENYANAVSQYMTDINTFLSNHPEVEGAVVSVASASGAGSMLPVIGVRVGEVVDTQRRRRNKLAENYHDKAVPYPTV